MASRERGELPGGWLARRGEARIAGAALLAVPLLLVVAGCDWLRPGGAPEDATIYVSSQDVDEATLVVAPDFDWVPGGGPGCDDPDDPCPSFRLRSADTALVDLPHTYDFRFTSSQQLYATVFPDASVGARMAMRVEINGDERFNGYLEVGPADDDGNRQKLEYAYSFRNLR